MPDCPRPLLIDSHCHLMDRRFKSDLEEVLERSRKAGVREWLVIGTDVQTSREAIELAKSIEGCRAAVGIAPHEAAKTGENDLAEIESLAQKPEVVALGEIGLEYHYDVAPKEVQRELMADQLQLAQRLHLPVIFHHRKAEEDFKKTVECAGLPKEGGVMHCFTAGEAMHRWALELGLSISFTGIITFKNSEDLRKIFKATPLDKILIETDAPYLAPVPHRGKRCEPAMLADSAKFMAEQLGLSFEEFARQTVENTRDLFF